MKASLFAFATMAMGAFAAPTAVAKRAPITDVVQGAVDTVTSTVNGAAPVVEVVQSVDIVDVPAILNVVGTVVNDVTAKTDIINDILGKVKAGDMTKEAAQTNVFDEISTIQLDITALVSQLTGAAGIPVADGDVDKVLDLVNVLLKQVLTTVNAVVTVLGLTPQLTSLLHSVFSLLANLLVLLNGLLAGLLPAVVATLSPLLATLGNGLLAPLLTPLVGLLAGIAL